MNSKNTTEPLPAPSDGGRSPLDDRTRHLLARRYAGEILDRALEENMYRSSVMPWPAEEHPAVMRELQRIRDTLWVVRLPAAGAP